ncbi:Cl-channel voltage-gated family protein [Candidatus Terasakiella magnetica]|uniref:Cl-channel voltage-gated family protein n=1 Tax=Candidatus Terasakiella magnetica TaxID=1867952 RepID=A0A1C3RKD1_9PROT|nr:Cl-channel voltage-gated family protein [Candidatus Terasakiella magnetica]
MSQGRNRPSPFILFMRKLVKNDQLVMTLLAVVIGGCVGSLAILFVEKIDFFQSLFLGISGAWITEYIRALPAWKVVMIPTVGGLGVGLLLYYFMPGGKPKGPADVIAACEVGGGQMSLKEGVVALFASTFSLACGASVGREGPAVHMGATFASWASDKLQMSRSNTRVLLGCGVAAAVSASFNAPIAGALFAQEVILSHYALKAFAPVVIASVSGTVVAHQVVGNVTAFELKAYELGSYLEFPAFVGLGIASGLVGILFVRAILKTQSQTEKLPGPQWYKPALGGFCVGLIALWFPEVLGVGYEATDNALKGQYGLALLFGLFAFKFLATVISLGFGFGGGVFSPALVIGAMLGGTYGTMATSLYPDLSSGASAYSLIGMAAMAAAVLGAPISTTLIVFELTGDYSLTIAVMCGCVMATLVNDQMDRQSFFLEQLKARGLDLMNNVSGLLLQQVKVSDILKQEGTYVSVDAHLPHIRKKLLRAPGGLVYVIAHDRRLYGVITWEHLPEDAFEGNLDDLVIAADIADTRPPVIQISDTLDVAQGILEEVPYHQIAVVNPDEGRAYVGCIEEREVMNAYNEELLKKRKQEHGG